jgi:hypothetical protein
MIKLLLSGLKVNLNKSELIPLAHSKVEIYTHNFLPGIEITTDKFKLLGIIIPTNGKQNGIRLFLFSPPKAEKQFLIFF